MLANVSSCFDGRWCVLGTTSTVLYAVDDTLVRLCNQYSSRSVFWLLVVLYTVRRFVS